MLAAARTRRSAALLALVAVPFALADEAPAVVSSATAPARADVTTPPPSVRARYRRCASHYRLVYLRGRIGCYRPHKRLRKPRCAAGYHHPSGRFTCVRDTAQPAPRTPTPPSPQPAAPAPKPAPAPAGSPTPAAPTATPTPAPFPNPAPDATQFWSTGSWGVNGLDGRRGQCTFLNAWILLRLTTEPPTVYGHAGDPQTPWVRFRSFLVNHQTGELLAATDYSDWASVSDNSKANFPAWQKFEYPPNPGFTTVLQIRIEWWSQTQMIGAVAHEVPTYNYYVGGAGPIGPLDSCAVFLPSPA